MHMVQPLLTPYGQVLQIAPPCVIDSVRHNDRRNVSAAKYVKVCIELEASENVHVLDLHTYFNTTYPDETVHKTYYVGGMHFSEMFKLLVVVIHGMFDKDVLDKISQRSLLDSHDLVPYHA
ncbi:hypothetical protein PsorP6_009452 [Peronosclerospora sorghi]|uniref:Uncharacterized protein n=1 Tax=Peronosclerospora sorghi TaxID=230839 RepID=A0ACC0W2D2_9STRA|nr:hypothetical protein PsorP6_009452 [Peronosclerospora sorghi]